MKRSLIIFLISILASNILVVAQSSLLITPKRVVFEGNKQKAELSLMNTGSDTATFSISFRHYKMTEFGKLEPIEDTDSITWSADPYIRFFPRQVKLAPGEGQVVMLQCRRKPDMKAGEYRSHLWFKDEKDYTARQKGEKQKIDSNQLSVSLTALVGITIPVFVLSGDLHASAKFSDLKFAIQQDTIPYINLTVNKVGNSSLTGKLTVEYCPTNGKSIEVGRSKVVIYPEINKQKISLRLTNVPDMLLRKGKLKISISSIDGVKKKEVFAMEELDLK